MGFQKIIPYKNLWDGAEGSIGTSQSIIDKISLEELAICFPFL